MHSTCSDGQLTPIGLVEPAARRSVKSIAITDHDTVEAFEAARAAAKEHHGTDSGGQCLGRTRSSYSGLFFDRENAELQSLLTKQTARRLNVFITCERLLTQGIEIERRGACDCGGNADALTSLHY